MNPAAQQAPLRRSVAGPVGGQDRPRPQRISGEPRGVLDQEKIKSLRETLTPEMRAELVRLFDSQVRRSARELAAAVRSDDHAERHRVTHGLKGSSATLGASEMGLACSRLEAAERSGDRRAIERHVRRLLRVAAESTRAIGKALD
jgi:HPt (histidine-containing phosphotransfer) domain-containing protein